MTSSGSSSPRKRNREPAAIGGLPRRIASFGVCWQPPAPPREPFPSTRESVAKRGDKPASNGSPSTTSPRHVSLTSPLFYTPSVRFPLLCTMSTCVEGGASTSASAAALPPRDPSLAVTHALLGQFYRHVTPLRDLFPSHVQLLQDGDSDAFRKLVEETMVASTAEEGVGELRVEPLLGTDVSMRDVSYRRACASTLSLMLRLVALRQILQQVHTRLFTQHARVAARFKKGSGVYMSATPKNVLALGFRPVSAKLARFPHYQAHS